MIATAIVPLVVVASLAMNLVRQVGISRFPRTLRTFRVLEIFPLRNRYIRMPPEPPIPANALRFARKAHAGGIRHA
jgi:hypothetical protein